MLDPDDDDYYDDLWGIPKHVAEKLSVGCVIVAVLFGVIVIIGAIIGK